MQEFIRDVMVDAVGSYRGKTAYRTPLVGFAPADDPRFATLKEAVGPGHLMPQDLLPAARSVVAFFIPFTGELVRLNRDDPHVSRAWAEAYVETNRLIDDVCHTLADALGGRGVRAAWQQPTHNFDPHTLTSFWSHRHVAYLCSLGAFGRHHLLITAAGCAGRLGSLVLDAELPIAAAEAPREFCLYRRGRSCQACIRRCPSGALTADGLDRQRCYRHVLEVADHFRDLGLCDVCGKCATGPCALEVPGEDRPGDDETGSGEPGADEPTDDRRQRTRRQRARCR
jgi:epoxyqueuosine reductase